MLCRASHTQGILVYDLQHGTINDQNPWYGKEFREKIDSKDLPDIFLCWDKSSAATLEKWIYQKGISVDIIGNPWFQRFLRQNPDDLLIKESLSIAPSLKNNNPTILVSLQWGMMEYFGKYVFNGVIPDALEQTILKTAKSYNWLLRYTLCKFVVLNH